ncbi:MAG: LEA type 2 family protein [Spongiibacteraceae bacterium]|nr:LEA type 2 family protein [Spongiibacteraceae bacterium]
MLIRCFSGRWLLLALLVLALSGCAFLRSSFVQPEVALANIRLGTSEGLYQQLYIDLMVTNPGRQSLALAGLHYRLRLEGRELVKGTSWEPFNVGPGETVRYTVPAGFSLLSGLGFVRDLLNNPRDQIRYELEATLEPDSYFLRPLEVRKTDFIQLTPAR